MNRRPTILGVFGAALAISVVIVAAVGLSVMKHREAEAAASEAALEKVTERRVFGATLGEGPVRAAIDAVLDDFHAAAAEADGKRYFRHFTPNALFVGTDATERWTVEQFRAYAQPYFDEGTGWDYAPRNRRVDLALSGRTAVFYEELTNEKYGELRGSGALVHDGDRWRILQYVLSFAVPNDVAPNLVELTVGARGGDASAADGE